MVLTDVGGSAEAIARAGARVGGLLVEPDARALAAAVRRLADHPELRAGMGAFAREHALAHFDRERTVEAYVALFERAAGDSDTPPDAPRGRDDGPGTPRR